MLRMDWCFINFSNESAWWSWTETYVYSAWFYDIKLLCLTVHFLCISVIVNTTEWNRIHVCISQVHLLVSWMNNCTNYVRNSLLAKRFLGNKNDAVCVRLDTPALDQYCRMWIIRSTWSSLPWHFVSAGSCQVFNSESCHDIWISNVRPEFRVPLPCSVCPYTHVHSECNHNVINTKRRWILTTIFFRLRKSMYSVCFYRLHN